MWQFDPISFFILQNDIVKMKSTYQYEILAFLMLFVLYFWITKYGVLQTASLFSSNET